MEILSLFKKKKTPDPKLALDIPVMEIEDAVGDEALIARDFYISSSVYVDTAVLSPYGAVFIIHYEVEPNPKALDVVCSYMGLSRSQAFMVHVSENESVIQYMDKTEEFSIYDDFSILFENMQRPGLSDDIGEFLVKPVEIDDTEDKKETYQYEGVTYVMEDPYYKEDTGEKVSFKQRISEEMLTRSYMIANTLSENERPDPGAEVYTDENGNTFIRKYEEKKVLGIDTGLVGEKKWYQLSGLDTDRFSLLTAMFGWSGFHRFSLGEIPQGLLYLLTGGCMGILPFFDLVALNFGNLSYQAAEYTEDGRREVHKVYLKRPGGKLRYVMPFVSLMAGIVITLTVYRFGYEMVVRLLGSALENTDPQKAQDILSNFGFM